MLSNTCLASLPTVDFAAIAQSVRNAAQQAREAYAELSLLKSSLEEGKKEFEENKKLMTGNSHFGNKYNDPILHEYLPTKKSWEDIYKSIDSSLVDEYRKKYHLNDHVFDKYLINLITLEKAYNVSNLTLENLQNLQKLADSVKTPQEKEDIHSRLEIEEAKITNEHNRLTELKELMSYDEKLRIKEANEYLGKLLSGEMNDQLSFKHGDISRH
jgi:hypothetical protein